MSKKDWLADEIVLMYLLFAIGTCIMGIGAILLLGALGTFISALCGC